jgi:NAD(P) transhydrogenase subunit alpha
MVDQMAEGSVVVDLAADSGGNCELSEPGIEIDHGGVTLYGMTNPPAAMPTHASFLYSRNMANFLGLIVVDGELRPDFDDEIVSGSCVLRSGTVVHEPTRGLLEEKPQKADAS